MIDRSDTVGTRNQKCVEPSSIEIIEKGDPIPLIPPQACGLIQYDQGWDELPARLFIWLAVKCLSKDQQWISSMPIPWDSKNSWLQVPHRFEPSRHLGWAWTGPRHEPPKSSAFRRRHWDVQTYFPPGVLQGATLVSLRMPPLPKFWSLGLLLDRF